MTEFEKQSTEATEQYMAALAKTQEQILEQTRLAFAGVNTEFAPQLDVPGLPVDAPSPREVALAAFSFAEKMLAQQRAFVEQYLDIAAQRVPEAPAAAEGRAKKS